MAKRRNDDVPFKELQNYWYQKLKDEGFEDIEDVSSAREYLKAWHSTYFCSRYPRDIFAIQAEYYRRAGIFYHEFKFKRAIEKEIWKLHSEGVSIRDIAEAVEMNRNRVHSIVSVLIELMKEFPIKDSDGE